ncbi:MAG: leucine--tRNA ligase [Pseudomonadota bacterium]|nr:leucine--tRNA ligase [Pseudomonadota bacterium]
MSVYPFKAIESKWQKSWEEKKTFRVPAEIDEKKPKFYALDMFPYPSGEGLHVGHPEGYTASDIVARYKRMKGFNVLHPIGWDAFGLPAEQYAIKTGTHPKETTEKNISNFRKQLKSLGFSYDWDREINTTDSSYYKWTQWIFKLLFERGLAYQQELPVWWCEELGTTLANEEVINGFSEIGNFQCTKKPIKQWVLKITDYAEKLLEGLDSLDWPESTKEMQRNWIGKSEGAEISFRTVKLSHNFSINVFTTRPDTLFGATYLVMAPEHKLVKKLITDTQKKEVVRYIDQSTRKSDLERTDLQKTKTGVFTGSYAINPVNKKEIPIWVADYVLAQYGTGAIMAVPGEDDRDWEFAEKYSLPIIRTVKVPDNFSGNAYTGDGESINSGFLNGLMIKEAKKKIVHWLEENNLGKGKINYKIRDWIFSRQRYWGEPFPIIYSNGEAKILPEESLPIELPEIKDFRPSGSPEGPLVKAKEWVETKDPRTREKAQRETNTMPQWAGSCWYFLRYIDPNNKSLLVDPKAENYWMPVDLYIGGSEHAVLHLLYARFWHRVLYDAKIVSTPEPFQKLIHQGMILGELEFRLYKNEKGCPVSFKFVELNKDIRNGDTLSSDKISPDKITKKDESFFLKENHEIMVESKSYKMSKSRGNVINPDDIISKYGADSFRLYEMFMGPLEQVKPWNNSGVEGTYRFLNKIWRLFIKNGKVSPSIKKIDPDKLQLQSLHITINKVTNDIENFKFNTAISSLMEFINGAQKWENIPLDIARQFILLLSPFAPHISEEIWEILGKKNVLAFEKWPGFDKNLLIKNNINIAIQINGKLRANIEVKREYSEKEIIETAKKKSNIKIHLKNKNIVKVIYVPGRILNFVAK